METNGQFSLPIDAKIGKRRVLKLRVSSNPARMYWFLGKCLNKMVLCVLLDAFSFFSDKFQTSLSAVHYIFTLFTSRFWNFLRILDSRIYLQWQLSWHIYQCVSMKKVREKFGKFYQEYDWFILTLWELFMNAFNNLLNLSKMFLWLIYRLLLKAIRKYDSTLFSLRMWRTYLKLKVFWVFGEALKPFCPAIYALLTYNFYLHSLEHRAKLWNTKSLLAGETNSSGHQGSETRVNLLSMPPIPPVLSSSHFVEIHHLVDIYAIFRPERMRVFSFGVSKMLKEYPMNMLACAERAYSALENAHNSGISLKQIRKRKFYFLWMFLKQHRSVIARFQFKYRFFESSDGIIFIGIFRARFDGNDWCF